MSGTHHPPDTRLYDDKPYLLTAKMISTLSLCERKKVGCAIVVVGREPIVGHNRLAIGSTACKCEDHNVTRGDVLHAEEVAVLNAFRAGINLVGATVYCTCSPCLHCAALLSEVGISRVVYGELYRNSDGLKFLQDAGIEVVNEQDIRD